MIRISGISGELIRFDANDVTLFEIATMVRRNLGIPQSEQKYYHGDKLLPKATKIQASVDLTMLRCQVSCEVCGDYQTKRKYQSCAKCSDIFYCSDSCQREDWQTHKKKCIKHEHKYNKVFPNGMRDNHEYDLVCDCGHVL